MAFVDGFLGLATAISGGSVTEASGAGYQRQQIAFSIPKAGMSGSSKPYTFGPAFGSGVSGQLVGRAVYDSPSGGNLLLIMPFPSTRPLPASGPLDMGDDGFLSLTFTAMQSFPDGSAYSGSWTAGSAIGTCYDRAGVLGPSGMVQGGGYVPASIASTTLTCGANLVIVRGVLQATSTFP